VTDDSLIRFAQTYRLEAAAVLVQVAKDETAPAAARSSAAEKILAYSDGKPSQARQLTVGDLQAMPDDLKMELLQALLSHYMPDGFQKILKSACDDAVAQFAAVQAASLPKLNRTKIPKFVRRAPVADLPPALEPAADAISGDLSADLDVPGGCIGDAPASPLLPPSNGISNVTQLPGTRREHPFSQNCDNDRPALMTKARPPHRP
jgi:hypothetical protein